MAPQAFGPFLPHRSIGKSAIGEAYLAHTPWPEHKVAVVKIYTRPITPPQEKFVRREHPNVVTTLDVGSTNGKTWVACELVPGKSVARIVPRIRALRKPTPPSIAVRLWADLLTGLAFLHERRPHGAITPGNVVVAYSGGAKLSDVELGTIRETPTVIADLFGAASSILRLLGKELPIPLDAHLRSMLATDVAKRPPSARIALERLLESASQVAELAPRNAVGVWSSELFAGEKAEELAELEALRDDSSGDQLPWFGEAHDEASTSSWSSFEEVSTGEHAELETQILEQDQLVFQGSEETSAHLIEALPTDRSVAPMPRNAKVRTIVLDDEPSRPHLPPVRPSLTEDSFGRYKLMGKIGDGGMAEVRVAHLPDGKPCVIKRVAPGLRADADFLAMFREEARIAPKLKHPNVVACLDAGAIDGVDFIAFELVPGLDLGELIAELAPERIPISAALEIAVAIARALDYAHRLTDDQGRSLSLVHRDVSPENVVISWSGDVKLLDFGISRFRDRVYETRAGVVKGKLGYLSPEQLAVGSGDEHTDLYQLGVVFAEMLSGQRLFPGDSLVRPRDLAETRTLIDRHLGNNMPPRLIDLVTRLCAPDRDLRPATAKEALDELEQLRARAPAGPTLRELVRRRAPPSSIAHERTKVESIRAAVPLLAGFLLLVTGTVAVIAYLVVTR